MWAFSCFKSITGRHPPEGLRSRNMFESNPGVSGGISEIAFFETGVFALAFPESSVSP